MSAVLTLDGTWLEAQAELPTLDEWLRTAPGPALRLAPADDAERLAGRVQELALVEIEFPRFTDGRGYSLAVTLRRLGYAGELRAVGEILIDQVFLLKRVGFTQFALRSDQDRAAAVDALTRYSEAYQAAADLALPLYRRRARPLAQPAPAGSGT